MSFYSTEDIFKAGWEAYHNYLRDNNRPDNVDDAYTEYQYKKLKEHEGVDAANKWATARKKIKEPEGVLCPDCSGAMVPRTSSYGKFWGCKDYPKCKGTRDSLGRSKKEAAAARDKAKTDEVMEEIEKDDLAQNTERSGFTFKKG